MRLKNYFEKLNYLDELIRRKATGTPKELAKKLNVSERTVYNMKSDLEAFGAPVSFDRNRSTYYYEERGRFEIKFVREERQIDLEKIIGGKSTFLLTANSLQLNHPYLYYEKNWPMNSWR